jgi:hypothetical protein
MDLTYCNINNNNAVYDGGGLCNYDNINSFTHSTINGNTSNNGGAIYNSGTISTISFSTISNNMTEIQGYSTPLGGGIYNVNGIISNMYNVTISGNYADIGGAIYQTGSSSNIDNLNKATISANTASIQCGGINLLGGSISVKNTIIAGNTSPDNYDYLYIDLFSAVLNDNGYNIVGISNVAANATGGFNHSRSILFNTRYGESGTNFTSWTRGGTYTTRTLDILPLEDNGGLTKTMGLEKNSLANYAGIADIDEDQREYKRKSPPTIGAFEFEAHIPTLSEWSVIIFIGLLAGVGGWFVWRRA